MSYNRIEDLEVYMLAEDLSNEFGMLLSDGIFLLRKL